MKMGFGRRCFERGRCLARVGLGVRAPASQRAKESS
jgi:hypothetical protein